MKIRSGLEELDRLPVKTGAAAVDTTAAAAAAVAGSIAAAAAVDLTVVAAVAGTVTVAVIAGIAAAAVTVTEAGKNAGGLRPAELTKSRSGPAARPLLLGTQPRRCQGEASVVDQGAAAVASPTVATVEGTVEVTAMAGLTVVAHRHRKAAPTKSRNGLEALRHRPVTLPSKQPQLRVSQLHDRGCSCNAEQSRLERKLQQQHLRARPTRLARRGPSTQRRNWPRWRPRSSSPHSLSESPFGLTTLPVVPRTSVHRMQPQNQQHQQLPKSLHQAKHQSHQTKANLRVSRLKATTSERYHAEARKG
eukprot:m.115486 g.115486  ORF g.115486 m.115486 type:complete len:305 (-) comp21571_c0_seq2:316-1230(-)